MAQDKIDALQILNEISGLRGLREPDSNKYAMPTDKSAASLVNVREASSGLNGRPELYEALAVMERVVAEGGQKIGFSEESIMRINGLDHISKNMKFVVGDPVDNYGRKMEVRIESKITERRDDTTLAWRLVNTGSALKNDFSQPVSPRLLVEKMWTFLIEEGYVFLPSQPDAMPANAVYLAPEA